MRKRPAYSRTLNGVVFFGFNCFFTWFSSRWERTGVVVIVRLQDGKPSPHRHFPKNSREWGEWTRKRKFWVEHNYFHRFTLLSGEIMILIWSEFIFKLLDIFKLELIFKFHFLLYIFYFIFYLFTNELQITKNDIYFISYVKYVLFIRKSITKNK